MSATKCLLLSTALIFVWTNPPQPARGESLKVAAKRKPTDSQWQYYETRTVDALPGFSLTADNPPLDQYGGAVGTQSKVTGFFHAQKIGDRWWLIDPLGNRFLHIGVCSVAAGKSAMDRDATKKRFAGDEQWARATNDLLREHGFNGSGAWTATELLRAREHPPVYTQTWSFMGAFGRAKKLTRQESGHLGYVGQCIPVFHLLCIEHAVT